MLAAMAAVRGLAIVLLDIVDAIKGSLDEGGRTDTHPRSEAMAMVCSHVIGQDAVMAGAACRANTAQHVPRPLIVTAMLNSLRGLGQGCEAMRRMVTSAR
jgi:fumarate hydratase class II